MNLVCFDPQTGAMRRYYRGEIWHGIQMKLQCTGEAKLIPWDSLSPDARVVSLADIETFRLNSVNGMPLAPEAA